MFIDTKCYSDHWETMCSSSDLPRCLGLSSLSLDKAAAIWTLSVIEISELKKANPTSISLKYHKWRMNVSVAAHAIRLLTALYAIRSLSNCRSFLGAAVEDMQVNQALGLNFHCES